jgi:hypothetical protein
MLYGTADKQLTYPHFGLCLLALIKLLFYIVFIKYFRLLTGTGTALALMIADLLIAAQAAEQVIQGL